MPLLKPTQFADLAGISRQRVSVLAKSGRLLRVDGRLDPDHPINADYLASRTEPKKEKKPAVVVKPDKPEPKKKGDSGDKKSAGKTSAKSKTKIVDYSTVGISKTEADINKILVTTANEKVKLAQRLRTLILKEEVDKLFGRLYSIVLNFFHPLGQRLAPIVAGICGVTDPVKILKIEKAIDKEIMRGLGEFKKEAEKGV